MSAHNLLRKEAGVRDLVSDVVGDVVFTSFLKLSDVLVQNYCNLLYKIRYIIVTTFLHQALFMVFTSYSAYVAADVRLQYC